MFGPCIAIQYLVSFLVCNHSAREERECVLDSMDKFIRTMETTFFTP